MATRLPGLYHQDNISQEGKRMDESQTRFVEGKIMTTLSTVCVNAHDDCQSGAITAALRNSVNSQFLFSLEARRGVQATVRHGNPVPAEIISCFAHALQQGLSDTVMEKVLGFI